MRAFGYDWHQTLVGRIEAAQRPLRLNEAVDLAALYGVDLERLLSPASGGITAGQLDEQIEQGRSRLEDATQNHQEVHRRWDAATTELARLADELTRAETRVRTAEADLARLLGLRGQAASRNAQEPAP